MKAVNDYVVIESIKAEPKKIGGLILNDKVDSDSRYLKGNVYSIGDVPTPVKEGDIIWYDRHAGHEISYDEKLYKVIRVRDIVIVE